MNNFVYVPSLKGKRGEKFALKELSPLVKEKIKPIINVIKIKNAINFYDENAFIDFHEKSINNIPDSLIVQQFEELQRSIKRTTKLTSVIKHGYPQNVLKQIKPYLFNIDNGIALRIPRTCLSSLKFDIDSIVKILKVDAKSIDVIVDFGCINDMALGLVEDIAQNICKAISDVEIRNLIVLSSAFPVGISTKSNTIGEISRYDWNLFKGLNKLIPNIIFGDYGADDPFDPQIDSRVNIVPTIRYTTNECWKIIRGSYDPAMPYNFSQFTDLSKELVKARFYKGKTFSWGDLKIYQCANSQCSTGNLETWVRVAMNHHITLAANECAHSLGI